MQLLGIPDFKGHEDNHGANFCGFYLLYCVVTSSSNGIPWLQALNSLALNSKPETPNPTGYRLTPQTSSISPEPLNPTPKPHAGEGPREYPPYVEKMSSDGLPGRHRGSWV